MFTPKLAIYARAGITHVWLVDALARTLEVFRLDRSRWVLAAAHGGDAIVRAEAFEALEIHLARWWPPIEAGG